MYYCKFCRKEKELPLDRHLKNCREHGKIRREFFDKTDLKSFLHENIWIKNRSILDISQNIEEEFFKKSIYYDPDIRCDLDVNFIIKFCKDGGIKTRNLKESAKLCLPKRRKTMYGLYGVDSPSRMESVKLKKIQKSLEKYGTINVFQSEEVKKKSIETNLQKYGVPHYIQLGTIKCNSRRSAPHKMIESLLEEFNIEYFSEVGKKFMTHNKSYDKLYSPIVDILIEKYKLVIEINSDYYHANPNKYTGGSIIMKWGIETKAEDIWYRDKIRQEQIESFGYTVLNFWGSEIGNKKLNESFRHKFKIIMDEYENNKNN